MMGSELANILCENYARWVAVYVDIKNYLEHHLGMIQKMPLS